MTRFFPERPGRITTRPTRPAHRPVTGRGGTSGQTMARRGRPPRARAVASGFSLLEMLAVVAILGILVATAQAAWWRHVATVRRSDATVALMSLAAAQEAYYLNALSYSDRLASPPPDGLGFDGTERGWYRVSVERPAPDRFRLIAVPGPGSPQQLDEDCRELWVDQAGTRGSSPAPPATCWR